MLVLVLDACQILCLNKFLFLGHWTKCTSVCTILKVDGLVDIRLSIRDQILNL